MRAVLAAILFLLPVALNSQSRVTANYAATIARINGSEEPAGSPCTAVFTSGQSHDTASVVWENYHSFQFTSDGDYTDISQIRFQMYREGSPGGTMYFGIYTDNANDPGTQIGDWSSGVLVSTIGTSEESVTLQISGNQPDLSSGVTYHVVIYIDGYTESSGNRMYVYRLGGSGSQDENYSGDGSAWSDLDGTCTATVILYTGSCP